MSRSRTNSFGHLGYTYNGPPVVEHLDQVVLFDSTRLSILRVNPHYPVVITINQHPMVLDIVDPAILAIGTLVIPEALRIVFFLWRPVGGSLAGGGAGYMLKGTGGVSMTEIYWLALVIGVVSVLLMRAILHSKLGLGLAAIRDNDKTAASSGINVFRLKLSSFIIGAIVSGIAGAIFYIYQGYIEPTSAFSVRWTMILMLATVIGGMSTEEGPIVGTIIVVFLHFLLVKYAGFSLLIQGVILVGIMLLAPQGIMGFLRKTRPYRSLLQLATRR